MAFDKISVTVVQPKPADIIVTDGNVEILINPSRTAGIVLAYLSENVKIHANMSDKDFTAQELSDIQSVANMIVAKLKAKVEA